MKSEQNDSTRSQLARHDVPESSDTSSYYRRHGPISEPDIGPEAILVSRI